MKTIYALLYCWNQGNSSYAELKANSWDEAIALFRESFSFLNENGYCKDGPASWIVAEQVSIYI